MTWTCSAKIFRMMLVLTLLFLARQGALACTVVTFSDGKTVLVGNNEDYSDPNAKVWFIPASADKHGRICWGFDAGFEIAQGGMNDQGLFIDANAVPPTGWKGDPGKPDLPGGLLDHVLATCATVGEVVALFESHNAMPLARARFPVADARGESIIIEWGQGKLQFLKRQGRYQIATNFVQSDFKAGEYPCDRYRTAETILSSAREVSIAPVRFALAATSGSLTTATIYSTICDLKRKRVWLYNFHNFEEAVVFDLPRELAKGKRGLDIASLFLVKTHQAVVFDRIRIKSGREELLKVIRSSGIDAAIRQYHEFKKDLFQQIPKINLGWAELDALGYDLLKEGRLPEALAVFELNVAENPVRWEVYDSLGEACLKKGDAKAAEENYRKSLELNPENMNAIEVLKRIAAGRR